MHSVIYSCTFPLPQKVIGMADAQSSSLMGGTPLMFASVMGQVEIVKWLLEIGCDINAQDENNKSVRFYFGSVFSAIDIINFHFFPS